HRRWSEQVRPPHPVPNGDFRERKRKFQPKLSLLRVKVLKAAWAYLQLFARDWRLQPYLKSHWHHLEGARAIVLIKPPPTFRVHEDLRRFLPRKALRRGGYYHPIPLFKEYYVLEQKVLPQWVAWERSERARKDREWAHAGREKVKLASLKPTASVHPVPGRVALPLEASGSTQETSSQVSTTTLVVRGQLESALEPGGSLSPVGLCKDVPATREDTGPQNPVAGSGQNEAASPGTSGLPDDASRPKSRRLFSSKPKAQVGTPVCRQPESALESGGSSSPVGLCKDVPTREDTGPQNPVAGSGQNEAPPPGTVGLPAAVSQPKSRRLFSSSKPKAQVGTLVCRKPESALESGGTSSPAILSKDVPTCEDTRLQNLVAGSGKNEAPSPGTAGLPAVVSHPKSRRLFSSSKAKAPFREMQVSETSTLVGTKDVCEKPPLEETRTAHSLQGGGDSLGLAAPSGGVESERQPEAKEPELAPEKANPVAPKQESRNTTRKKANSVASPATENLKGGDAVAPVPPQIHPPQVACLKAGLLIFPSRFAKTTFVLAGLDNDGLWILNTGLETREQRSATSGPATGLWIWTLDLDSGNAQRPLDRQLDSGFGHWIWTRETLSDLRTGNWTLDLDTGFGLGKRSATSGPATGLWIWTLDLDSGNAQRPLDRQLNSGFGHWTCCAPVAKRARTLRTTGCECCYAGP
ncbi:hypothetical protein HDU87_004413, partial [Geranomyces variabilis]